MTTVFNGRPHDRFTEIKRKFRGNNLCGKNQGFNFPGHSFSNGNDVRT